jgi:pimeloyl-ACP methyl ester carboxylesterase
MLARVLGGLLAAELLLYALVSAWLYTAIGLTPFACGLLAAVIAVAARLAIVAATFTLAHLYRGPSGRGAGLSAPEFLRLFWLEFLAFTALFTLLQPLERWFTPRANPGNRPPGKIPVLFVHGIYCNAAVWWYVRRHLQARGLDGTFAIDLEPPFGDIDDYAGQLARRIEEVCAATSSSHIVVIGHSMGGLVARACLQKFAGPDRIAKLITLGSPHHGSGLAYWGVGRHARQMRPGSSWLQALNRDESKPPRAPIVSIFTRHDNFVAPQESSVLAHATNVPLAGIAHLSLLFSSVVAGHLYAEIVAAD